MTVCLSKQGRGIRMLTNESSASNTATSTRTRSRSAPIGPWTTVTLASGLACEVVTITPAVAAEMLKRNTGNRNLKVTVAHDVTAQANVMLASGAQWMAAHADAMAGDGEYDDREVRMTLPLAISVRTNADRFIALAQERLGVTAIRKAGA